MVDSLPLRFRVLPVEVTFRSARRGNRWSNQRKRRRINETSDFLKR